MKEVTRGETIKLELPVKHFVEVHNDKEYHVILSSDETRKLLDISVASQADSKEEAIEGFWRSVKAHLMFCDRTYLKYNRWALFIKGPWNKMGGRWFSILGFHFSFRYGKGMKGGWYVPLTKLNISFINYWRKKYDVSTRNR